jgi:aminoglycoside phosphotransferase family enzyme
MIPARDGPTLADKVAFLSQPGAYGGSTGKILRRETHMSWLFFAGDRVFKLKKPVRFAYLDFSTLGLREAACRAEVTLNRRLAQEVYLKAVPLVLTVRGLAIGAPGIVVDWLVVMRRLNEATTLEQLLCERRIGSRELEHVVGALAAFYRHALPARITPELYLARWYENLRDNRRLLLDPDLATSLVGLARRIDRSQRRFLDSQPEFVASRVLARKIVDGHGDLRPEHIFIDDTIRIIDCLEFNPKFRAVDPLDEVAYLSIECARLGAPWASTYLSRRILHAGTGSGVCEALFCFYRCYRATLRARLTLAHLLEPKPRTPEKWLPLARTYLQIANVDANHLESMLRTRADQ